MVVHIAYKVLVGYLSLKCFSFSFVSIFIFLLLAIKIVCLDIFLSYRDYLILLVCVNVLIIYLFKIIYFQYMRMKSITRHVQHTHKYGACVKYSYNSTLNRIVNRQTWHNQVSSITTNKKR